MEHMASQDDFHVNLGMGGLLPACPHTFRDALDAPITFPQSFLADAAGYDLKGSCCISTMLHDKCLPPDGRALLRHDAAVLGETPNHFFRACNRLVPDAIFFDEARYL